MGGLIKFAERRYLRMRRWYYTRKVRGMAASCGRDLKVAGKSSVNCNTHLGNNVNFNGLHIAGTVKVVIGDNFHSAPGILFLTRIHNYNEGTAIPYDATYIVKEITIGDNVWLGARVIVLGGVTIGEGAIIQAGSCVVTDIPKYGIAGGHPAKVFSQRDIDHYEKLKAAGKFH